MPDDRQLTETILDYLRREYADSLAGVDVAADTPLISSGLIDSISMVSLKVFLEYTCHLRIPDQDASAEAFDSVKAIVAMLRRLGAT
jgi:acyl carrier protein